MKEKTWNKMKENWPLIFTAAAVSILANAFFTSSSPIEIFSTSFLLLLGKVTGSSFGAVAVIYFFLWLAYKGS